MTLSVAVLIILSAALHTTKVHSAYTSLDLLQYPSIIPTNAPFINVKAAIPDTEVSQTEVVVIDIIASSDINQATQTYTRVAARAVDSPPDYFLPANSDTAVTIHVPLARKDFDVQKQPYYIHAWIGPAGLLLQSDTAITIQDPSKLSHPLAIVTMQVQRTYSSANTNCVNNQYIGFILDALANASTGSQIQGDQVRDLVGQGLNLFRTALPPPPSRASELVNFDVSKLKARVDEIQSLGAKALIDLPLFYSADAVPFNAVFDATKGEGNIFLVPRPTHLLDSRAMLEAVTAELQSATDLILLPTQIIFAGIYGLKNVGAFRELAVTKSSFGCAVEPFNMLEVKQLTQQLKAAKLKGLISRLSAHKDCSNKTHELLDHLAANSDVWYGWVWDSVASYQVAPEYTICKATQVDALQTIFGGDSKSANMKFYVLIAIVVAVAGVIMILTGLTLWLHLRRQKLEKERRAKGKVTDSELRAELRKPNPSAKHGRYEKPIKITFVDH